MKPLQVGITVIGTKNIGDNENASLTVHYGNYITPHIGGRFVHLPLDEYLDMLSSFLKSPEGELYIEPSQVEINEANKIVIAKEKAAIEKLRAEISKNHQDKEAEHISEETVAIEKPIEPAQLPESSTSSETLTMEKEENKKFSSDETSYKKQTMFLASVAILLTLVNAFQMLLNLYLLIRK